jgi:hypothetical protein
MVTVLVLWGSVGPGSILAQAGSVVRPDPENTVFLDNCPIVEDGSDTYDPDTRTCGNGKYKVFSDLIQAIAALKQADYGLLARACLAPKLRIHGQSDYDNADHNVHQISEYGCCG